MSQPLVLQPTESRAGAAFDIFGNTVTVKVSGPDTGGAFATPAFSGGRAARR